MKSEESVIKVLILRFSALGDITMTAPVVRAYALAYPKILFTMASAPKLAPLFKGIPNLHFEPINTSDYRGVIGLFHLYKRLSRVNPHLIIDLHQVLRTYILCVLFWFRGVPISAVKKGRSQKRRLTRVKHKHLLPLPSMISRYELVFTNAGFKALQVDLTPLIRKTPTDNNFWRIGIAPFAKHAPKEWPLEKMERLVEQLSNSGKYRIFLFGGGVAERDILEKWASRYANTQSMAGTLDFSEELTMIGQLDLLVSMDSANMHFASFMGVPVVSIWGGTHPFAGFYGWRQDPNNAIQVNLPCRPCSVFGSKPCRFGNLACLQAISVEEVLHKIELNTCQKYETHPI